MVVTGILRFGDAAVRRPDNLSHRRKIRLAVRNRSAILSFTWFGCRSRAPVDRAAGRRTRDSSGGRLHGIEGRDEHDSCATARAPCIQLSDLVDSFR